MNTISKIPQHLTEKIKSFPQTPGIYQMKDKNGNIIYIGKSKTLRSRVKSYFYVEQDQSKIKRMVSLIQDIEVIMTDTHLEAQILECELIKKVRPIFNRQFKNDKNYVYLKVEQYNKHRTLSVVRERNDEYCFGPYRHKNRLIEIVQAFENVYPILQCEQGYQFNYEIFPRALEKDDFEKNRASLISILTGEASMEIFQAKMKEMMEEASAEFRFEVACVYRDWMEHLQYLSAIHDGRLLELVNRKFLLGEKLEEGYKVFYISNHRIVLKKKYKNLTRKIIEGFLGQAEILDQRVKPTVNEKRELDFKKIISKEVRTEGSKTIIFCDEPYCIDHFIDGLR